MGVNLRSINKQGTHTHTHTPMCGRVGVLITVPEKKKKKLEKRENTDFGLILSVCKSISAEIQKTVVMLTASR